MFNVASMMLLEITEAFSLSNYAEALLWMVMGLLFLISQKRFAWKHRVSVAMVLIVFGFSDVVEASTGAWWTSWWLLVWKGVCVIVLSAYAWGYFIDKQRNRFGYRGMMNSE